MADAAADVYPKYEGGDGSTISFTIADGVTVYRGSLVGLESGYLNHWADGASDQFAGLLISGDVRELTGSNAGKITGETSDDIPPKGIVLTGGITLRNMDSVLGPAGGSDTVAQNDVGAPVYCKTSNLDDLTMDASGSVHMIGLLTVFRSATDVDVKLLSIGEAAAHKTA